MTAQPIAPPTIFVTKPRGGSSGGNHKATKEAPSSNGVPSPSPTQRRYETNKATGGRKSKATSPLTKTVVQSSPAPDPDSGATQKSPVGGELDTSHACRESQSKTAGVLQPPTTNSPAEPNKQPSGWLELRIWAEMLNDAQKTRIAASNRGERGGVDPEVYRWHVDQLEAVEHGVALAMRRTYRRVVPAEVVQWQKTERGIGEHLLARLLGHLGDPYIATPHAWLNDAPEGHVCDPARCGEERHLVAFEPYVRKVSQLWSYCGVGDPTRKRRAGMSQEEAFGLGSPICKMLIHLLAEACMKQPNGNRYRDIYSAGREKYATRENWKPGRQHNAALRLVKKELLRDLWLTRHHATNQHRCETQTLGAGGDGLQKEAL